MRHLVKIIAIILLYVAWTFPYEQPKADPVNDIAPHVVAFRLATKDNARYATGFHLEYRGKVYIVTNKHVCDLHISVFNHKHIQFDGYIGEIIYNSHDTDLCLVTSNRTEGLSLATEDVDLLDPVILVGFPRGMGKVIRYGRVIEKRNIIADWVYKGAEVEATMVSTITYGGNSGSPVTNKYGEVVGVLFAGSPYYPTEGLIINLDDLKLFLALYAR